MTDVKNAISKFKERSLGGKARIHALFDELERNFRGHLEHLFFAHPYSIEMLKEHPDILMLDCTYKTNAFNMPFLHIVGINSMNLVYEITFCFLSNEQELSYNFAIKSLSELFTLVGRSPRIFITDNEKALKNSFRTFFQELPQRLCQWHLSNNLEVGVNSMWPLKPATEKDQRALVECLEKFQRKFQELCSPKTLDLFDEKWNQLEVEYQPVAPLVTNYIRNCMLSLQFEWADWNYQYMPSLGQTTTSPLDGSHRRLKSFLKNR